MRTATFKRTRKDKKQNQIATKNIINIQNSFSKKQDKIAAKKSLTKQINLTSLKNMGPAILRLNEIRSQVDKKNKTQSLIKRLNLFKTNFFK